MLKPSLKELYPDCVFKLLHQNESDFNLFAALVFFRIKIHVVTKKKKKKNKKKNLTVLFLRCTLQAKAQNSLVQCF